MTTSIGFFDKAKQIFILEIRELFKNKSLWIFTLMTSIANVIFGLASYRIEKNWLLSSIVKYFYGLSPLTFLFYSSTLVILVGFFLMCFWKHDTKSFWKYDTKINDLRFGMEDRKVRAIPYLTKGLYALGMTAAVQCFCFGVRYMLAQVIGLI